MKTFSLLAMGCLFATASTVSAHATFQQLWVNGVDQAGTCVRKPNSNSPVKGITSTDLQCNVGGTTGVASVCTVPAGGTVTVEMHQQPGDRSCSSEAIGGKHNGPVLVYLSKVGDATKDMGSKWFKIYQNGLVKTGYWATDVLNDHCGKQDVKIPADIAPGDYLLRAEVIALHVASSPGGAEFYVSCYQIRVTGGGRANPPGVSIPGAYSATDPGILFNLYTGYDNYTIPGPAVYEGGAGSGNQSTPIVQPTVTPTPYPTHGNLSSPTPTNSYASGTIAKYSQCGGVNWTGSGTCVAGLTCTKLNPYYHQCL